MNREILLTEAEAFVLPLGAEPLACKDSTLTYASEDGVGNVRALGSNDE